MNAGHSDPWSGMPWQVKAIGLLGLPTIAAIAFAWVLIIDVRSNQRALLEQGQHTQEALENHNEGQIFTQRTLRAVCLNIAATERAAQNCEDPWSATRLPIREQPSRRPEVPGRMFDR